MAIVLGLRSQFGKESDHQSIKRFYLRTDAVAFNKTGVVTLTSWLSIFFGGGGGLTSPNDFTMLLLIPAQEGTSDE